MQIKSIFVGATIALAASLTSVVADEPAHPLESTPSQFTTLTGIPTTPMQPGALARVRGAHWQVDMDAVGDPLGGFLFVPVEADKITLHACIVVGGAGQPVGGDCR